MPNTEGICTSLGKAGLGAGLGATLGAGIGGDGALAGRVEGGGGTLNQKYGYWLMIKFIT